MKLISKNGEYHLHIPLKWEITNENVMFMVNSIIYRIIKSNVSDRSFKVLSVLIEGSWVDFYDYYNYIEVGQFYSKIQREAI